MSEAPAASPWRRLRHSLRLRLVLLFLLLALAMSVAFIGGVGKALSAGWRGATEPLFVDYADRLVAAKNSPAVTYAALGWSVSVKGAESAARGFAKYHEQHGSRVTVEMVEGLA